MPVVKPGSKVLVTGANGYVAFWLIRQLLEKGYSVRGTVRSIAKGGAYIKEYFKSYGDRFELVEVSDFTKQGAFDEAVQGVDAVQHVASPLNFDEEDPQAYIVPAVEGTLTLLSSALKYGSNLKRVIYVSSSNAVTPNIAPAQPTTFSEKDWNDTSIKETEALGKAASPDTKYSASKALAEKAGWDFFEKHKNEINWDFTVLNPTYIFGPVIHQVTSPASLNVSIQRWWSIVVEPGPQSKEEARFNSSWIDVRDLADALILAIEKEAAGGERIIVTKGPFVWQDWINAALSLDPSPIPSHKLPVGFPEETATYTLLYDTSKADQILGVKYRSIQETARDMLADFAARGW